MAYLVALMAIATGTAGPSIEILEFSAQWCGPCRTMAPAIEQLRQQGYPLRTIDVDQETDASRRYQVTHLPTVVVIRDGTEVGRLVGFRTHFELAQWFKRLEITPGASVAEPTQLAQIKPEVRSAIQDSRMASAEDLATATHTSSMVQQQPGLNVIDPSKASKLALAATVRIRVEDTDGASYGTGTIIDATENEALVVTCGHIFRDSNGQGKIQVDLFANGAKQTVSGRLLTYDAEESDIGFLVIRSKLELQAVQVASASQPLQIGMPVFSIGCDHGTRPSLRKTHITAVNRYSHGPNLETEGQPMDGRSGGGLFTSTGFLIGICQAADHQENKGLFASLPLIHQHLAKLGLQRVILQDSAPLIPAHVGSDEPSRREPGLTAVNRSAVSPARTIEPTQTKPLPSVKMNRRTGELICVVRDPVSGRDRVLVIRKPTDALIASLEQAATPMPSNPSAVQAPQTVIRGQSQD